MTITLNAHGLERDGETLPVYSGTIHYWRLERERWPLILDQAKALGFDMIETYIPWAVHEVTPGRFDWGDDDPRKDLEAFMQLCEARGLWLIVRPGPLINAELTDFGFPEWVLLDPDVQAKTALGTIHFDAAFGLHPPRPFPVPSYASEKFYALTGGWFDALAPLLKRHLAPAGCIVAVQSDNETCYLFHDQAYATDYSGDSLALYRRFLADRYGTLAALNAAYGTACTDIDEIEPPRDCDVRVRRDLARHIDWIAYKEYQITWAVARFARMWRERGIMGVPMFHDVAFQYDTPVDVVAMEADPDVDWVGMNLYRNREDYAGGMKRIRYLAGSTRLPFVPEFGNGLWSHHARTFEPDEHEFITLGALMHGLKAFNFYMLVERDRWQGSAITRHGALRRDRAPFYAELNAFLKRTRFWEFEKSRDVLVLFNYDAGRYAALATTGHYAHVDLLGLPAALFEVPLDLGLKADPSLEADIRPGSWLAAVTDWLGARHIAYDHGDTHLTVEQLERYPLVCLPAVDFLDAAAQQTLLDYVARGGRLVLGPELPTLDPALNPCALFRRYLSAPGTVTIGSGTLTWARTDAVATALEPLAPRPTFDCDQPSIDLTVHKRGNEAVLFAANPTGATLPVTLTFDGAYTFTPAFGGPALAGTGAARFDLPAYTTRVWEVSHD